MEPLGFSAGQARYRRVAERLRQRILRGEYAVGSLLPTEVVIGSEFGVSRATVREAMRRLQAEGLVSRRAGVGTRVDSASPASVYSQAGNSIDDLLAERIKLWPLTDELVEADDILAEELRATAGQKFLRLEGLVRRIEDTLDTIPLYWATVFVAAGYADIRDNVASHNGTVANLIETKYGESVSEIHQEITPILVEAPIARHLSIRAGTPALRIKRWYYTSDPFPSVIAITLRPAGRFTFTSKLIRQSRI